VQESRALHLRYGLDDERCRTLQEVGEVLGVTRERIRQIEMRALQKLSEMIRHGNLKEYLQRGRKILCAAPWAAHRYSQSALTGPRTPRSAG
jgi:hypothetical protein